MTNRANPDFTSFLNAATGDQVTITLHGRMLTGAGWKAWFQACKA